MLLRVRRVVRLDSKYSHWPVSPPFPNESTRRKYHPGYRGRMRILVVEDEPLLADAVAEWLRGDAHAVDVAHDGREALERIAVTDYDVVVLDRDLPVVHGDEVCRELHSVGAEARILMLTAAAAVDDRVAGLVLGADDYLSKPFAFPELAARVVALG